MMAGMLVGIDLGTTNSAFALWKAGAPRVRRGQLAGREYFDEALVRMVEPLLGAADVFAKLPADRCHALLNLAAERTRRALTTADEADFILVAHGTPLTPRVTTDAFEEAAAPLVKRLSDPVIRALRDCHIDVRSLSDIVLVGGATRMPVVRKALTRIFGGFPNTTVHPDHAVTLGAAIHAGLLSGGDGLEEIRITGVAPFTLGVGNATRDKHGRYHDDIFAPIIERNTPVPVPPRPAGKAGVHVAMLARAERAYEGFTGRFRDLIGQGLIEFQGALWRAPSGWGRIGLIQGRDSMRKIVVLLAATAGFGAPASLAAQDAPPPMTVGERLPDDGAAPSDDGAEMAALAGMMGGMFKAEPLTAEQQARLPQAEALITQLIPEGAMAEMSQAMFGNILGPLESLMPSGAKPVVADRLGPEVAENLSEEQAVEVANLFDPAWKERESRVKGLVPDMLTEVMSLMEPTMRKAMSELYAIRFSSGELTDIAGFFATDTGAKYARESFSMTSDPRLIAASMEMMPALFGMMGDMEQRMKARMADLSEPRSFAALSNKERNRVSELTGLSVKEIEGNVEPRSIMVPPPRPAE